MDKRGESIVEVVVACGILSLLFSSIVGMVVSSIGLNSDAKLRMEAVALAQTNLNNYIVNGSNDNIDTDSGTCPLNGEYNGSVNYVSGDVKGSVACISDFNNNRSAFLNYLSLTGKSNCSYIETRPVSEEELDSALSLTNKDYFVVVESHIKWLPKAGNIEEYVVSKMLRIK